MQQEKLTVLIPFKNREENLKVFIPYFHNYMKNYFSNINYNIVIIEQGNDKPFNKGILFNAGFLLTGENTDYYALHDVDQIPISANYSYNKSPYHLCVNALEQSNTGEFLNPYKKENYPQHGGCIVINKECYIKANGHSNNYWGWGGIDDDFLARLNFTECKFWRYKTTEPNDNGYFITLNANTKRFYDDENYINNGKYIIKVVSGQVDWRTEGLNTTKFKLLETINNEDYTKYIIDFDDDVVSEKKIEEKVNIIKKDNDGVSIVMAYHNRKEQLIRTLNSILLTKYDLSKLEIIIVNDNSNIEHSLDNINELFPLLNIKVFNIKEVQKNWMGPSVPYNIGFNHVRYDKVIIQNPESYHKGDVILDVSNRLTDSDYLSYACYSIDDREYEINDYDNIKYTNSTPKYACGSGWYNHSKIRPSFYHFCSAITTDNLNKLNGFDEDYKDGIGFDDNEILFRIKLLGLNTKMIDSPFVLHQFHESIYHYDVSSPQEEKIKNKHYYTVNEDIYYNKTQQLKNHIITNNKYFNK